MEQRCIIIGAGHAGSQAAISLRNEGHKGSIILINGEDELPYHRPPLSKSYLQSPDARTQVLRPARAYQENGVELLSGMRVASIHPDDKTITCSNGQMMKWRQLVLALGARARMPELPAISAGGVVTLRSFADARRIRALLPSAQKIIVVGGGFIGMELAHSCASLGKSITVIEAAPRVMARAVVPIISEHIERISSAAGIKIITETLLASIESKDNHVRKITTSDGREFVADMVVLGMGALPNVELAVAAGISTDNGILVDDSLRTSASNIYAIGDCVSFHHPALGQQVRLESVQNAVDQARHLARSIMGEAGGYNQVAWFWSDLGKMKLQIAGLGSNANHQILSANPEDGAFSVFQFEDTRLVAVDSINQPAIHMIARRFLAAGLSPTEADIEAGTLHLKSMVMARSNAAI